MISLGTGRFELRERLGRGGAGEVYEAYDREHERSVALKLLPKMSADDIGRLKHEFRALSDVAHPNLVRLYELVSDGAQWFFTMELVRGSTFLEHVRTPDSKPPPSIAEDETLPATPLQRPLAGNESTLRGNAHAPEHTSRVPPHVHSGAPRIPELRDALAQLAQGVAAIHAAGKLHCDLKPHNVLVAHGGRVVVLDFGLVTDARGSRGLSIRVSRSKLDNGDAWRSEQSTSVSGTPAYMAPEQAAGERMTEASDWYAVGVMLYEALTGRLPFDGPVRELMRLKQVSDPAPPELRASHLPADLCALCMALLQRDPAARLTGSEILRRLGRHTRGADSAPVAVSSLPPGLSSSGRDQPLVGRDREIAAIEEAIAIAERKQPIALYVRGQAGIGKTRLLSHVLSRVAGRPSTVVLAGRCYERERLPFKAVDSVIDALTSYLLKLEPHAAAQLLPRDIHSLSRVFPILLRVPSIAEVKRPAFEAPDPHEVRRRAFSALKDLLRNVAERATLIVHIDDLHWGDVDSASLLIDLLEPPDPPAMLFIASFRAADATSSACLRALLSRFPTSGVEDRLRIMRDLPVAPLSAEDSVALVQVLSPGMIGAEVIAHEAAGNPFFVAQLVHFAGATESPTGVQDDATRSSWRSGNVKISLEQVLRERMQLLPKPALDLLEVVAIAGRPIARDIAVGAAEVADADSALAVLRVGAWLRSQGPRKDDVIECYHDRVREVVAQSIEPERLRARHEAIALKLEQSGQGNPVDLAEHFGAAGQNDKAALYAQRAAESATYALAFDDAARWYELALSLSANLPSAAGAPAQNQALRVKLAESLANAGRTAAAAESYTEAARFAEPHLVLELRRRAAEQWLVGGHIDEGVNALHAVLEVGSMRLAKTPRSALLSLLSRRARVKLRGLQWVRRAQAEIPPAQLMQIDTCWSVATTLGTVDTIRAADFQARHLLLALSAGEPYRVARALAVEAGFAATAGGKNRARAEAVGKSARELALELQEEHPHALGLSMTISGMTGYLMGEWAACLRDCDAAEKILLERCTGVLWELTQARRFALSALSFMGNLAELAKRAPKLLSEARERGQLYAETDLRARLMTSTWLAEGKPELAEQNAEEALQRWSQHGFHLQHYNRVLSLANCAMYRGDAAPALARLDETWPQLERSMLMRIQALRAEIWHARGRALLGALGQSKRASAAEAQRVADKLASEQMAWTAPLAAILRAGVSHHRGQHDAARAELERAAAGFEAVDMQLYAAAAHARLGTLLGGDTGAEHRAKADTFFAAHGIADGNAFIRMLAPGFG